jgi:ribonuclease-3
VTLFFKSTYIPDFLFGTIPLKPNYASLCRTINHTFKQETFLITALTHRSAGVPNNERLEFLGDALLGYIVAENLFQRFSEADEGELSRLRANLVNAETLAEIARSLGLGDYLHLGSGELKSGGNQRTSILADALEALIGAVYLDADIKACKTMVLKLFQVRLETVSPETLSKDPKTRLQEYLQANQKPLPIYQILTVEGMPPTQQFTIECIIEGLAEPIQGTGDSRRRAEQAAAEHALELLINV